MLCVTICFGQTRWKFRSDNYLGFSAGELGSYGLVQTVNGLYRGPWFLGLGTGLDYYRFRSVPVFLSLTRDIPVAPKRGGFFLTLNGGINLPWYQQNALPYGVVSDKLYPGVWWNAGLGYRWKLSEHSNKALLFTAGYGVKRLSEHQKGAPGCIGCLMYNSYMLADNPQTYDYDYVNRVWLFGVGFQF